MLNLLVGIASAQEKILGDLGFKPSPDGFCFANYTEGYTDLTPEDMVRLFGKKVIAYQEDGQLILTPPSKKWMEEINNAMRDGHCEGMAVLSLLLFKKNCPAGDFGVKKAFELQLDDNTALQREIAFWFATQATQPTADLEIRDKTPLEITDILAKSYNARNEFYTMGIYKKNMTGAHAVTPYALIDKGDGKIWIMIYDNNFPGRELYIIVDKTANTWKYEGSTNPDGKVRLYEGDAIFKTLTLAPLSPRLQTQTAPFLGEAAFANQSLPQAEDKTADDEEDNEEAKSYNGGMKATAVEKAIGSKAQGYNQMWLEGAADLLITDEEGKKVGYDNGLFVHTMKDAQVVFIKNPNAHEPIYNLPTEKAFSVLLKGTELKAKENSAVVMIGPGYDLEIENIMLDPGQVDQIYFSPAGNRIAYKPGGSGESPNFVLGFDTARADYEFEIDNVEVSQGGMISISIDFTHKRLKIFTKGSKEDASFVFKAYSVDGDGERTFRSDSIVLKAGDAGIFDFAGWDTGTGHLKFSIDPGCNGRFEEAVDISGKENSQKENEKVQEDD